MSNQPNYPDTENTQIPGGAAYGNRTQHPYAPPSSVPYAQQPRQPYAPQPPYAAPAYAPQPRQYPPQPYAAGQYAHDYLPPFPVRHYPRPAAKKDTYATSDKEDAPTRRTARGILAFCLASLAAMITVCVITVTVMGVGFERNENGSLVMWLGSRDDMPGNSPVVMVSIPPSDPVNAERDPAQPLLPKEIYKKVSPAVVGILSESYNYGGATGTGMIISADGYILTNSHVVDGYDKITVRFPDGTEADAQIIDADYLSDIAVIKIKGSNLPCVELASSASVVTGDICYAIGNPLGFDLQNSMTDGMISGVGRDIVLSDSYYGVISMTVLQTNCAVNPGNSGGPLVNEYGYVIGIVSSKIMGDSYSTVEGLGFAIPMDEAEPIVRSILEYGYVKGRPLIGITAAANQIDEETAADYGLPSGILLDSAIPGTDAYSKGIVKGDIVTHMNGQPVSTISEIKLLLKQFLAGDTITLTIYRRVTNDSGVVEKGEILEFDILLMDAKDFN